MSEVGLSGPVSGRVAWGQYTRTATSTLHDNVDLTETHARLIIYWFTARKLLILESPSTHKRRRISRICDVYATRLWNFVNMSYR